jgi:hypothetical protein
MAIEKMKALFGKKEATQKVVPVKTVAVPAKKVTTKKTVAKKVVAKKAPVKKAAPKKVAEKKAVSKKVSGAALRLVVASDSQSFWVHDGQVLNSLIALEAALKTMKPAVYGYHVNKEGNHFADWVEAVLGDVECAKAMRSAKTAAAAHKIVTARIKAYAA